MKLSHEPIILGGVGEGWEKIVEDCDKALFAIDSKYLPAQIKEKWGVLRFYWDSSYDFESDKWAKMSLIVAKAENDSAIVCEDCGQPGELRSKDRYWIRTLCDTCEAISVSGRVSPE